MGEGNSALKYKPSLIQNSIVGNDES